MAGIAALLLEANPNLTPSQLVNLVKQTARQDTYTGLISPAGDVLWGWGKVNAYHAARIATGLSNNSAVSLVQNQMNVYPNPTSGLINIKGMDENFYKLSLYDMDGNTVFEQNQVYINKEHQLNLSLLKRGTYLLILKSDKIFCRKIIIS
jgi:minor extracellular serine protease Vpr